MLLKSTTLTFAISFSLGTDVVRSSPESAGTGACVTGSCFIAIVPPVATTATVGRSAARDGAPQSEPAKTKPKNALYPPDQFMVAPSFVCIDCDCGAATCSQLLRPTISKPDW